MPKGDRHDVIGDLSCTMPASRHIAQRGTVRSHQRWVPTMQPWRSIARSQAGLVVLKSQPRYYPMGRAPDRAVSRASRHAKLR